MVMDAKGGRGREGGCVRWPEWGEDGCDGVVVVVGRCPTAVNILWGEAARGQC